MNRICSFVFFICSSLCLWADKWEGEGTSLSPYWVRTGEDLLLLAQDVNDGVDYDGFYFKMAADIDLSAICGDTISWDAIGSLENYFEGDFDGDGHTISNLYLNVTNRIYVGLFGYVGSHGRISNLSVSGSVTTNFWAGAVAGGSSGEIVNCAYVGGSINSYQCAGGIVGGNFGIVSNCRNESEVNGSLITGGVCGYNYGGMYDCVNNGDVHGNRGAGGLAGYNGGFSSFSNCYNTPVGIVQNCTNNASVSGEQKVGGVVGRNDGLLLNVSNYGELTSKIEVGGLTGYNGGFDGVPGNIYNSYNVGNVFSSSSSAGGVVGVNNPYGSIYNVYSTQTVFNTRDSSRVSVLVASNEGFEENCFLLGRIAEGSNGEEDSADYAQPDSLTLLTQYLNNWVDMSEDSLYSRWTCTPRDSFPSFQKASASTHNVLVYNFHGVVEEDLLVFSEGQQVSLNIIPDSNYVLAGAYANSASDDSIPVDLQGNHVVFEMPESDVSLYLIWQEERPLSVEDVTSDGVRMMGGKGELSLSSGRNMTVYIYTVNGSFVTYLEVSRGEERVLKLPTGVYLVNGHEVIVR